MSGVGEAGLVLGIISSIISIVTAAKQIYDAANDSSGLPKAFHKVAAKLPIVVVILKQADEYIRKSQVDQGTRDAFQIILCRCDTSAKELHGIFSKVIPKDGASRVEKYLSAAKKIGKGGRVEDLIADILKEIGLLLASSSFATQKSLQAVEAALVDISLVEPSLPANFAVPRIKVLQQIQYGVTTTRLKSVHPQAVLHGWLLPDHSSGLDVTTEHNVYLQKRFCDPEKNYSSCQWFFETEEYRKFAEIDSSKVLRIKGSPGCGKSVLSASIIHHLEALDPGVDSAKVLYYYCSHDPEQTSSMTLVRSFLAQCLDWATPEMILEVEKLHSTHSVLKPHITSNLEEGLWRLLRKILGLRTQKTYIIVDGLDECAQPLICLRHLIKVTTSLAAKAHCGLLLSSRLERRDTFDNKAIHSALTKNGVACFQLEITQQLTQRDLKEFVSFQVSTRPSFLSSSQQVRDKVVTSVCDRAHGMFLYASLALEDLKGETISSIADIDIALANLPVDIFNSYERKLELPRRARRGPETILWIFCANPSLTWLELKSALVIEEGGFDENEIILDSCEAFIQHSCGQLVESFGESERLRFIHPSVTDFLVKRGVIGNDVDVVSGVSVVASKLLTFLEYSDLPVFSSPITQNPEQTIREYTARPGRGLYPFATFNWHKYLKKCDKNQNAQLESQVRRFLESSSFVRWLKTAIIMSHVSQDGPDSASLTADVVDSLQSWMSGRSWTLNDSESKIQLWIQHFLDMMLDWGKVIETQPDWIHYLHQQLLPSTSWFRTILEENDSDQSIVQFEQRLIRTKHSEPVTWPERCIAIDSRKDLAFTYDEPFICCYHVKTGLMTAEVLLTAPSKVHGPLVVRRGVLSSNGKYLAVLFEAMGPSTDPIGNHIRAGRRLQVNWASSGFKWALDDASMAFDLAGILAHMAVGVDAAEFVVCLLEINHTGPPRTHLFAFPSWATSPILVTGTQAMRWDLDDVDVLQFSDDLSNLITAFGTFDLESGTHKKQWQFALSQIYQGGKVTKDSKNFVTVLRDIGGDCIVQFFGMANDQASPQQIPHREVRFSGVVHLLAVSNHGRFLLLTRREMIPDIRKTKSGKSSLPAQQASVGIWDCRDGEWTPLLLLDRSFVNRLPHWNFSPYKFQPLFGPEALLENEVNRVFLCVPSRWKLSGNVRKTKPLNPEEAHLILFEGKRSVTGFGKNPTVKLQLPATAVSSRGQSPKSSLKLVSWDLKFDKATIYKDLCFVQLDHEQLKASALAISDREADPASVNISVATDDVQTLSALLMSPTGSAAFHLQISGNLSNFHTVDPKNSGGDANHLSKTTFEITVACLMTGEEEARTSSVIYSPSPATNHPLLFHQYACASDEDSISLGFLELDLSQGYDSMSISIKDATESILQKAAECFRVRAHPLKHHNTETDAVAFVNDTGASRYVIFAETDIGYETAGTPPQDRASSFIIKGATSTEDNRHVFQASRDLSRRKQNIEEREALQYEVCLFVYDEDKEDITWMAHTSTGGDKSGSQQRPSETAWALHKDLPLLAWLLPGHRLRISNIETHEAPITIAESLFTEIDPAQAISFSPDGRYLLVQAQENFKNDLLSLRKSPNLWGAILIDLQEGKTLGATLISDSAVSMDVDNELLHTYRLTRDGAIESTMYTLPGMILAQRQYLTFIPAGCCCSTCGKGFDTECKVSVIEHEGGTLAILGHTAIGLGRASISNDVCQPLMIRITTPPVELNINGVRESVFVIGSSRLFPAILDENGRILDDAFAPRYNAGEGCVKADDVECTCKVCSLESTITNDKLEITWIPQMETKISDFKLPSGLAVPPEQIEELHRLSEIAGIKDASILKTSDSSGRESIDRMKLVLGDDSFPWDSWAEFKEAMEEVKEIFDHEEWMTRMFEPGNCGSGCHIPLFIHTFCYGKNDEEDKFRWSSAKTTGWLEEDLVWYYERFFGGSFEGARRWYEFPAYKSLGVKMDMLKQDKTAKGKRFRKYFGPRLDKEGKVLEIELPEQEGKDVFVRDGIEYEDEMKPMITGLIVKDVFESMSDLVPGLGKVFEQRLHTMLNQSVIKELLD